MKISTKESVRKMITQEGIRPDGRSPEEIRPIWCEVGVIPRVHGSGVFTRGQTQVMSIVTLGTVSDEQVLLGWVRMRQSVICTTIISRPSVLGKLAPSVHRVEERLAMVPLGREPLHR